MDVLNLQRRSRFRQTERVGRFRNVAKQLRTTSRASHFASQLNTLSYKRHTRLPSVGVLGLPCLDLRILSGLLRCPVQLALLDALELLHLVLPVQVVQVLPSLDLSDLQTHAAAGQSAAQQRTERAFVCGHCDFVCVWPYASVGAPSSY